MKTPFCTALLAVLFLFACNTTESLQEPIENLTSDWEGLTAQVTEFIGTLQQTQTTLQNQVAKMTVPEGLTLDENNQQQVEILQEGYEEQLAGLSDLSQTFNDFVGQWQEKSAALNQLQENLAAETLPSDAMSTVSELQEMMTDAKAGLEEWQGDIEYITENTSGIFAEFRALISNAEGN